MNSSQQEAIANADAVLRRNDLPTYTELRKTLAEALRHVPVRELAPFLPVLTAAGGKLC